MNKTLLTYARNKVLLTATILIFPVITLACLKPAQPSILTDNDVAEVATTSDIRAVLATNDISLGSNRISLALIDKDRGPLGEDIDVMVGTFYLEGQAPTGPVEEARAVFRRWPSGPRGVFTTKFNFDQPGKWRLQIAISQSGEPEKQSSVPLLVKPVSFSPMIGTPAPKSSHKTFQDVAEISHLTSDRNPDHDLYKITISNAIKTGKPVVIVFSTPAFCQTSTCGPQVDVIKALKQTYQTHAHFIHIEIYDNPGDIKGDLSTAIISPTVANWNLPSEPWTFIIDHEGMIRDKFEGFATENEIAKALEHWLYR